MSIRELMADKIRSGLRRQALTTPSRWACEHRIMGGKDFPGPWSFKKHPWLLEMHDSKAISNVGQKCAQVGFTEAVLNITFYKIDIERVDCLYILPASHPDAHNFSASRFDPALELSRYLSKMFSEVKNVGHKRAGSTNLYIRGSRSRSGLKSIPAGFIVFDELAEMDQANIGLALERASGQIESQDWKISTPTIEDANINVHFKQSTMEHFFFPCPSCSKQIQFKFPESIVITANDPNDPDILKSHYVCTECGNKIHHEAKEQFLAPGKWVQQKISPTRGFYLNQMYSPARAGKPEVIAEKFLKSTNDNTAETEFYNSNLGLTHAVKGAQINDNNILNCIGNYRMFVDEQITNRLKIRTMGIDVGSFFHQEVCEWDIPRGVPLMDVNLYARPRVLWVGKNRNAAALDTAMRQYNINFAVIDANPERRVAYDFANRWFGRVKMCFYNQSNTARQLVESAEVDQAIVVDRTSWLDLSLGRFHKGQEGIILPSDIPQEYKEQLKTQVREYIKDKNGNPVGRYTTPDSKADHFGHARNYCEIALALALGAGDVKSTTSPV